jgi:ATP-dependent Clp protease ATP-binding subunit ClpC
MLLGLMQEREGLAAKVLGNLGIEIGMVRETIEAVLGRPERIIVQEVVPTSRVKKVIEIAFEESRRMGHNYVSTEHLLLGLLIEGEGIGAHVLEDLGATLSTVRTEIDRLLKDGSLVEGPPVRASRASATPVLDLCGRDLTHLASRNQLDFLSGRDSDVTRVVEILSQQNRNCALIVGDPTIRQGVLAGLAWRMYVDLVPTALANRHLKTLEPKAILRNAKARGDFRSRLEHSLHETIEEVMSVRGTLLAIDDIHVFFGGGDREWAGLTTSVLNDPITTGQIQCIGCTTVEGYERYVGRSPFLGGAKNQGTSLGPGRSGPLIARVFCHAYGDWNVRHRR